MFAQLFTPAYLPFVFSFVIMLGIGLVEAIGLGLGQFDLDADSAADGGSALAWLGLGGEMPILIWLTSLLACFTLAGLAVQQATSTLFGAPLHPALAVAGALPAGLALNTFVANALARIMPGFETTVVTTNDLLKRRGTILEGTARRGSPARAKVVDQYGQAHFVMLEPHDDKDTIMAGETALLVRHEDKLFYALPDRATHFDTV